MKLLPKAEVNGRKPEKMRLEVNTALGFFLRVYSCPAFL